MVAMLDRGCETDFEKKQDLAALFTFMLIYVCLTLGTLLHVAYAVFSNHALHNEDAIKRVARKVLVQRSAVS